MGVYEAKAACSPISETIMVIPLGISVQLFSENITVFVVTVWIVVYTLIRYKKIPLIELNFLWLVRGRYNHLLIKLFKSINN